MTSTTDTAGHPDVAEISDLAEGLLPPSKTADVRRHLDECELCADVHASLEEIRGLLGTLPGPPRMPAEVASRIDAALAAEALLHATAPEVIDASAPVAVSSTRPPSDADDSARVSRETSAAADGPAGHARPSSTGPGRKERTKSGRRRIAVLGTVFTVAALGFGSVLMSTLNDGKPSDPSAHGQASSSADTFSESTLEKHVGELVDRSQTSNDGSRSPDDMGAENLPGSGQPKILKEPAVPPCVKKGIDTSGTTLALENGVYKGTDALLVVLRDASDATHVTAYIMDASCVDNAPSSKAKVLLKQSYAHS
ncbi:anti-sigma factor family protein [Streptomyces fulvoviolaceus]|uniref:anti-sigma factor family protein n=1 Tax=Streptomyces fulvoviolaceus TaxID=285535 RepID=UPI0004C8A1C1|nr:membrane protein [Streptomyces fulvoviolaceus]